MPTGGYLRKLGLFRPRKATNAASFLSLSMTAEQVQALKKAQLPRPERKLISFCIFCLRDDSDVAVEEGVQSLVSNLVEEAVIQEVLSSLVLVTFREKTAEEQLALIDVAMDSAKIDIKAVHGIAEALEGFVIVTNAYLHYGVLLPRFMQLLAELMKLEFGTKARYSFADGIQDWVRLE
ncbi:MAG TPA: hypothetical protein VGG10_06870 [Rhizomicrobium sp.]|jgi:hypothetical protein